MQFHSGDVLESVPPAISDKDVYLLCAVLHCFDDDTCVIALKNLASACGDTGARIAVMDLVVAASKPDLVSTLFDMQMFMGTPGRERTLDEWRGLIDRSGLRLEEVVNLRSFGNILVLMAAQ